MSCDCISRLESLLTQKMMEKFPEGEVIEPVEFQNKSLVITEKGTITILKNPTVGKVRIGKSNRKFDVSMYPNYCPYCGKLLEEKGGKK